MKPLTTYFVDTSFWIALLEASDALHPRAVAWHAHVVKEGVAIVTTEAVLWETLTYFAPPPSRKRAMLLYRAAHGSSGIEIVDFAGGWRDAAVLLYENRRDKAWSIVDCLSFEVMGSRGMVAALTADRHFEQARFEALLLREPEP